MKRRAEPRSASFSILDAVHRGAKWEHALAEALDPLPPRDRRLAHQIASGALRQRRLLDLSINRALTKPNAKLPAGIRDVLRIGVFQTQFLERVPEYAAVTSTVDLARDVGGERAAKLTNAVLRQIQRSGKPDYSSLSLAERLSHPDWLVSRWLERFGAVKTEQLLQFNNRVPPLTVQPVNRSNDVLRDTFTAAGISCQLHPSGFGVMVDEADVQALPGYQEGAFIVQDAAQAMLVDYASIPAGHRVWEPCAAPGGKAILLAQNHHVIVSDASADRLERFHENIGRSKSSISVFVADAGMCPVRAQAFDAVIIDAPCSATGTIARHPDARWTLTPKKIRIAASTQSRILPESADAVSRGGLLVYLTCSLESEENQDQVNGFLADHPNFERVDEDLTIFPGEKMTDGGFGARMRRVA